MKCHYKVLGVSRNATYNDIKAAYRSLALTWHPDKNLSNPVEATEQFQCINQAWDVLRDLSKRTWYDNRREALLKGSTEDYKDESINLFPYFCTMCFKGYGDDENGFYTVYCTVFEKIVEEDAAFDQDDELKEEIPGFGNSQSSYEEVVHNFYAYWQSYSTKKSFVWLNPHNLKHASNHRMFRFAQKENRKVRDKAKHKRNKEVRKLVAFVRKRDKRVQAHAEKLAKRARENIHKVEELKKAEVLERQKLLCDCMESEWSKFSNFEAELRKIEKTLGDDSDKNDMDDSNTFYCIVCNKIFKTYKAYVNHENSRKHKENLSALKAFMAEEDKQFCPSSSFQENNSTSTKSAAPNEPKLVTDSQISSFLTNSPENDTKELDNGAILNIGNTSQDKLISDAKEILKNSQPASEKEKISDDDVSLTEGHRIHYNCFLWLFESGNEDNIVSFEDKLISNKELAVSNCQKKKKNRRRRKINKFEIT